MSKTIKLTIDMEWVQVGCARIAKDCFEWVRDTEQDKTFDDIGYVTNRADIAYMCTNPKNAKGDMRLDIPPLETQPVYR